MVFGPGYEKVPYLIMIMATLLPIIGLSNVIGIQYLVTTKRESLLTRSVCIGAAANFVMNMILIHQLYSYGAAIASVISEVIITAVQLYFIRNELSIPKIFFSIVEISHISSLYAYSTAAHGCKAVSQLHAHNDYDCDRIYSLYGAACTDA